MACKIRIEHNSGYIGLIYATFPLEITAARITYDNLARVSFEVMSQVPGWKWESFDCAEGSDYVFLPHEYTIINDAEQEQ